MSAFSTGTPAGLYSRGWTNCYGRSRIIGCSDGYHGCHQPLIGVNATTVAAEAASAVRTYRALEAHEFRFRGDPSPAMKYGTFGDAVAQLIDAAGGGELPERFLNREVPFELQEAFAQGAVHVQLRFRPLENVRISRNCEESDAGCNLIGRR
jgi:hypothetical protein